MGKWRLVGEPIYTAIFPPGDEPDPAIVRAIRRFDPDFIPLACLKMYQTPTGGEDRRVYTVIARSVPDPEESPDDCAPVNVMLPAKGRVLPGPYYPMKTLAEKWDEKSWQFRNGVPEVAIPFDWNVYHFCKSAYWRFRQAQRSIKADVMERVDNRIREERAAVESVEAEASGRLMDNRRELYDAVINAVG